MSVALRRAELVDLDFLTGLYADESVRPFLAAAGRYERDGIAEQLEWDPEAGGLLIVELDGERAGAMFWELSQDDGSLLDALRAGLQSTAAPAGIRGVQVR